MSCEIVQAGRGASQTPRAGGRAGLSAIANPGMQLLVGSRLEPSCGQVTRAALPDFQVPRLPLVHVPSAPSLHRYLLLIKASLKNVPPISPLSRYLQPSFSPSMTKVPAIDWDKPAV